MKVVLREKQKPRSPTNVVLATFKGFQLLHGKNFFDNS